MMRYFFLYQNMLGRLCKFRYYIKYARKFGSVSYLGGEITHQDLTTLETQAVQQYHECRHTLFKQTTTDQTCTYCCLYFSSKVLYGSLGHWYELITELYKKNGAINVGPEARIWVVGRPAMHYGAFHPLCRNPRPPVASTSPLSHPLVWPHYIYSSPQVEGVIHLVSINDLVTENIIRV